MPLQTMHSGRPRHLQLGRLLTLPRPRLVTKWRCMLPLFFAGLMVVIFFPIFNENSLDRVFRVTLDPAGASSIVPCVPVERQVPHMSQSNEDVALLNHYYKFSNGMSSCNGVIVEIGALDGLQISNSYYFEYALGWKAVLIEAFPSNYQKLVTNRPGAVKVHAAMCPGVDIDFEVGQHPAVGGVADTMADAFRNIWSTGNKIKVPCTSLRAVFRDHKIDHVDVFSLDVEGGELAVLQTMDWSVPVDVWVVELDGHSPEKDEAVRQLLGQHGYVKSAWNIRDECLKDRFCTSNEVFERKDWLSSRKP